MVYLSLFYLEAYLPSPLIFSYMAASFPTPGQLVLENITLLSPTPNHFVDCYGCTLTSTTFSKPGNSAEANAVLHFLLCQIDPDLIEPLFKPCFPIRDREQERDFRRVVDSRLAVLEKSKLLPVGVARKSVVSSAGGDRFLDLLWSLSSLALQQACLRHPSYGPASRMRLTSQNNARNDRTDALSHQGSVRSSRSLLSGGPSRSDRQQSETQSQRLGRRFLGVGILSASQQRARDAEQIRARIDAERCALERTTELAKKGATTWASEADSLREKIGYFEAKLARLKNQLADMGFDENGNDIRGKNRPNSGGSFSANVTLSTNDPGTPLRSMDGVPVSTDTDLRPSSSRDDLADELKTSPIDSTESGSSVDELLEPSDGVGDITADLTRLLTFTEETRELRDHVGRTLRTDKPRLELASTRDVVVSGRISEAADIVDLVRAATSELEEATTRMDEIREERRRAGEDVSNLDCDASESSDKATQLRSVKRVVSSDAETSMSLLSVPDDAFPKEELELVTDVPTHTASDARTSSDKLLADSRGDSASRMESESALVKIVSDSSWISEKPSDEEGESYSRDINNNSSRTLLCDAEEGTSNGSERRDGEQEDVSSHSDSSDANQNDLTNEPTLCREEKSKSDLNSSKSTNETLSSGNVDTSEPVGLGEESNEFEESPSSAEGSEESRTISGSPNDSVDSFSIVADTALERHKGIVEASEQLQQEAMFLSSKAKAQIASLDRKNAHRSADVGSPRPSDSIDAELLATAVANVSSEKADVMDREGCTLIIEAARDLESASRAVREYDMTDRKPFTESPAGRRRRDYGTKSLDSITLPCDKTVELSPRYDTDVMCNAHSLSQASKRSVRFAELPPSYSRSRGGSIVAAGSGRQSRLTRCATEVHPKSSRSSLATRTSRTVGVDGASVKLRDSLVQENVKVGSGRGSEVGAGGKSELGSVSDGMRASGVSGHKPPRLERKQTPHRIVRQKDLIPRSVGPAGRMARGVSRSSVGSRNSLAEVGRASEGSSRLKNRTASVEDLDNVAKKVVEVTVPSNHRDRIVSQKGSSTEKVSPRTKTKVAIDNENKNVAIVLNKKSGVEDVECTTPVHKAESMDTPIGKEDGDGMPAKERRTDVSNDASESRDHIEVEGARVESGERDVSEIEKPCDIDDASSSSITDGQMQVVVRHRGAQRNSSNRPSGKVFSRNGSLRLSGVTMLGGLGSSKGRSLSMSSRETQESRESSFNMNVSDNGDVMRVRGVNVGHCGNVKLRANGGGFFAGETAQWQENVRSQTRSDGSGGAENSARYSSEVRGRSGGRGGGRVSLRGSPSASTPNISSSSGGGGGGGSGGSPRKSRVQSFRARLAALSRD